MKVTRELLVLLLGQSIDAYQFKGTRSNADWSAVALTGPYSRAGFGGVTQSKGSGDTYVGNVGDPYGSNIVTVSSSAASQYEYVVKFVGPDTDGWKVVIWNKIGPEGKRNGQYDRACLKFSLAAGEERYVAFAPDSQGGWAASNATTIPTDRYGAYASTWGEFDFGSAGNHGWSGFDVSVIRAQSAGLEVQGMKICSVLHDGICSTVSWNADLVHNAYTLADVDTGGLGGNVPPGPLRLLANIGFRD